MRKLIIRTQLAVVMLFNLFNGFAQDNENIAVKNLFWGTRLVDMQTTSVTDKNEIKFEILHRFGTIEKGEDNLFGIYAPSNIAMGIEYGLMDNLQIQFVSEKNNKTQELGFKYQMFEQNISNSIPVTMAYYFNLSIDGRDKERFGTNYKWSNRLFYTNQIIVSRQINYKFNISTGLSYIHYNSVHNNFKHDKLELDLALGYRVNRNKSIFISYQLPCDISLFKDYPNKWIKPKSGIAFGFETFSKSHNFQVFMSTRDNITPAKDLTKNSNNVAFKNLRVGFNIKVKLFGHNKKNKQILIKLI